MNRSRSASGIAAILSLWLQGCSVLVGNFDGYTAAGAADGAPAPPMEMGKRSEDAGLESSGDADAGEDLGPKDVILLPPRIPCQGKVVREFAFDPPVDVGHWTIRTDSPEAAPSLSEENAEGSPAAGALRATTTFTDSTQSVQVVTVLENPISTSCLSARLKVIDGPGNPELSNTKAGWYLFAVDADGCYAQSEIGHTPWWRYDITQAGVWYEVTANTMQLTTSQMCTHFDASRTQKLGIGIATSSSHRWHASFVIDTFRAY